MSIILIDDDEDDALLFCEAIKEVSSSVQCMSFTSAANAIDYLNNSSQAAPSHIFIDANMHPMDGEETLSALMNIKTLNDSRMIIHSGRLSPSQHEAFLSQGAHLVIHKAENYDQLCNYLRLLLVASAAQSND